MTLRTLCCGLILFSSLAANAGEILSSDQINLLKIERQNLIEERENAVAQIISNEKKIEMLLDWANGNKPSTIKDKVAPAASAVVAGGAATTYLIKYMPEVLASLPVSVQRVIKATPALAGIVAAVYFGYDSVEYHKVTGQLLSLDTIDKRQALYTILIAYREALGEEIELITKEINALDAQLNMYE
ncbi:MAG: hypothetical protein KDD38_00555 [Bdellovibrionales bacterium]|nr:hypothetical protein [Bdellovibrionales bacterium]